MPGIKSSPSQLSLQKIMKDQVRKGVLRSFKRLVEEDGYLFDCPIEECTSCDARKLHEICINHRLANHLEREILPIFGLDKAIFIDIEFNREGADFKSTMINGEDKTVRPDIIIHNRKTGQEKMNLLVVECKKQGASDEDIRKDREKIVAFMKDERYEYSFGLQVSYGSVGVKGELFFKSESSITSEAVTHK